MECGYIEEFYRMQASIKEKIKEKIPSKKQLTSE